MDHKTEVFLNILKNIYIPFLSVKDMKALYILNIINKNCEIIEYENKYLDTSNDNFLQSTVRETMFFEGKFYRLSFKYKDIIMSLYRENYGENIFLHCCEKDRSFKEKLDYISEFLDRDCDYTKEDILKIRDQLIISLDRKSNDVFAYKKELEIKEEKEEKLKKILYELMEE